MFGPAGRGRGRHTILPAWMTKGTDTAAAPAPAANIPPASTSSISLANAAPETEHRSRFGPRAVTAPIAPSSDVAVRKPSSFGVDVAKETSKPSRFADRPLKNTDESRRTNGHSRAPPRSSSSSRSRSIAGHYSRKSRRRGSSPSRSRSRSPYTRGSRPRCRKKSRSPPRRRSRSPVRGRSPSPYNRSRSPYRRKSHSPANSRYVRRSPRRSPSPGHPPSRKTRVPAEREGSPYRKPPSPRRRSQSRDKRSCSRSPELMAAQLCDRLLKLRNVPWKEREELVDDFIDCFNTGNDFYSEDPDGRALSFKRLLKRFFLDGPDRVEITRRLCFTESSTHSFCLAYERDEDTDQIVLYECRNSRIVRVYLFRDEKGFVSDKTAFSLSQIKDSSVYRQVFKYVCKKGIRLDAKPEYFDYVKDVYME